MKNIVITGANRGIGLALTTLFQQQGDNVYALCRTSSEALNALKVNIITGVDVVSPKGMSVIKDELKGVTIDILICNAGILRDEQLGNINSDTIREQFEVNALAPLLIAEALYQQIPAQGKVVMITSRMGSITDNTSGGRYGYRMSKAALNAAAVSLTNDLTPHEIAVGIFHPGYVQTDMVNHSGDISANECGQRLVTLINQLSMKDSGVFRHSNGAILPW
ncbi:SDR family oxidoreductase [Thalassotalea piscium]|uniref:NAD(P)-dependent dehydrogenase (Short-subunit alcohol dehydrogenase family) n=1 Tax=Thalassotalea piscium TaxID=1230533 RepID=A0A7X0NIN3_9GAMM|nr:SDR family oxidoreductase [Thalassotalea piscium]MBB6544162.1 NAD(P)-dependent dehydrogenase (short-subunit alcohol dehydrogenase family) [Thalassotalea piscium]